MKIIKSGDRRPRRFTCRCCGCVFIAELGEYTVAASGDNFFVHCPECKNHFDMKAPLYNEESDPFVIIDKTESTEYDDWTHSMYCDWMQRQGM